MFCHNFYGYEIFSIEFAYSGNTQGFYFKIQCQQFFFLVGMSLEIGNQPRIVMLIDKCEKSTCNREALCGVISMRCDSSHGGHHMEDMPGGKCILHQDGPRMEK